MIYSCSGIGDCRIGYRPSVGRYGVCPIYEHTAGFEPTHARGRFRVLEGLLEGRLELSKEIAENFFKCTTCGSCKEICHNSYDPCINLPNSYWLDHIKLWEVFREDLLENGYILPRHKEILDWCQKEFNPYMEKHIERINWLKDKKIPNNAEIIFFIGCTGSYRMPSIIDNVIKILEKANVEFGILGEDEKCCGSIALRIGKKTLARELAGQNVEAIKNAGAKIVITHCAGCYKTIKNDYFDILGELPFKILHITEFIEQLLKDGKLKFENETNEIVTYHDPCHLSHSSRIYDAPRNILLNIPKLKLIEMKRNRENTWCCGAGGGVKSGFPELALEIGVDRIQEAKEINADILTTNCPFCLKNLKDAAKKTDTSLNVIDITDLILRALKE